MSKLLWWFGIWWLALSIVALIFGDVSADVGDTVRFYATMTISQIWFATSLLVKGNE